MNNTDLYITIYLFLLFFLYGFSNIYVILFLRKKRGEIIGIEDFFRLYLGNIKNYFLLNKKFVDCSLSTNGNQFSYKAIALCHKVSLILILANFPLFMALAFVI